MVFGAWEESHADTSGRGALPCLSKAAPRRQEGAGYMDVKGCTPVAGRDPASAATWADGTAL